MLTKGKAVGMLGVFIVLALFFAQAMAQPSPTHTIVVTQGDNGKITPAPLSGRWLSPKDRTNFLQSLPKHTTTSHR